jgi:hypothetical protein
VLLWFGSSSRYGGGDSEYESMFGARLRIVELPIKELVSHHCFGTCYTDVYKKLDFSRESEVRYVGVSDRGSCHRCNCASCLGNRSNVP